MKSVLFIVPRFGSIHRGVEVFAHEISSRINKDDFEVSILSGFHGTSISKVTMITKPLFERKRGERIFRTWIRRLLIRFGVRESTDLESLTLMLRSIGWLKKSRFDLVIPLGGYWTFLFPRYLCRGARIIGAGHGGPVSRELKLADHFIALSPEDEKRAREKMPGIQTTQIPNGVDVTRFKPSSEKLPDSTQTILTVGALVPSKRHDLLMDAMMLLDPSVKLLCIGRGPLENSLKNHPLARQGRVTFLDLTPDEMPAVYHRARVFSLASLDETFGIVFLEALACGLRVVANDKPRQRYVLGDAGLYCYVEDSRAYASALQRALLDGPNPAAVQRASTFSWDTVTRMYETLFNDLTQSKPFDASQAMPQERHNAPHRIIRG